MPRFRRSLTTIALLLLAGPVIVSIPAQERRVQLAPSARAYLELALDTMQATVLGRDTLPWQVIRDSALLLSDGAERPADTYGAIEWALRRVNKHSFLQASAPGAVSTIVRQRIGYIHVPQRGGRAQALADSLHDAVRTLAAAGVCGWIVDLRGNGGGNMWPMLAGIGPLLGDSLIGSFGGPAPDRWYYRNGISGILRADGTLDTSSRVTTTPTDPPPMAPLAVLFDESTGSSGEAVAIAFVGRPMTRSFGEPTAGFATANRGARLPDGANMVLTTSYYTDRLGREHGERLQPDTIIEGGVTGWPFPTDRVARAASDWLERQPGCAR